MLVFLDISGFLSFSTTCSGDLVLFAHDVEVVWMDPSVNYPCPPLAARDSGGAYWHMSLEESSCSRGEFSI